MHHKLMMDTISLASESWVKKEPIAVEAFAEMQRFLAMQIQRLMEVGNVPADPSAWATIFSTAGNEHSPKNFNLFPPSLN